MTGKKYECVVSKRDSRFSDKAISERDIMTRQLRMYHENFEVISHVPSGAGHEDLRK